MKKTFKFLSVFLCAFLVSITNVNAASTSSKCDINISKNGSYSPVASTYSRYKSVSQMGHETENVIEPENGKCKSGYSLVMVGTKQMCQKDGTGSASGGSFKIIEVKGPQYKTDKGPAYCIQPGKSFTDGCYCEVSSFNLSECKDKPNKSSDYRCGLAYILINNKEGDYGTVLTALRLWAAYRSTLGGMSGFGAEDVTVDNSYLATTNFYSITAKAIVTSGYTGAACEEKVANEGLLCSGATNYQQSISMFNAALGANGPDIESGGEPKLETKVINKNTSEVKYSNIYVQEKLTGKVKIILKYNGKEVHSDDAICEKGECKIILSPEKIKELCEKTTTVKNKKWTVQIKMENYNAEGLIKEYDHCTNPGKNQKMMVINTKSNSNSSTGEKDYESPDSDIIIACEPEVCDETDKCPNTEMVVHNNLLKSCSGYDTYNEADLKDPYMNCILNACDEETKAIYDQSEKFGVNTETCRVYCREESHYYLANKTKVYAGMQFLYKIEERGVEVKANTEKQHLTSVVLQKLQCTSEIYYDRDNPDGTESWLDRYDDGIKKLVASWNEWKKWEALDLDKYKKETMTALTITANNEYDCGCQEETIRDKKADLYFWPPSGSSTHGKTEVSSIKGGKNAISDHLKGQFKISNGTTNSSHVSGEAPTDDTPNNSRQMVTTQQGDPTANPPVPSQQSCQGSCGINRGTPGKDGDPSEVPNYAAQAKASYESAQKYVANLIYDLQNCNLKSKFTPSTCERASSGGDKAFDIMKEMLDCEASGCIELDLGYDDKKYGATTKFGKTDDTDEKTYYCKNSSEETAKKFNPECYNYKPNTEVELEQSSSQEVHHEVVCTGQKTSAKCETRSITLPTNDNITFIATKETDFYQPNVYNTKAYTGVVSAGEGDGSGSVTLGKNVFPVSLDKASGGQSGTYGVDYLFTNLWFTPHDDPQEYNYKCSYDVYNNTTLYDCKEGEECDGCSDDTNDTVPISENINGWTLIEDKKYGYVYRPVDLSDLFPDEKRKRGKNWSITTAGELIEKIEQGSDDVYQNDGKLQYSYTLSSAAINRIRDYNEKQNNGNSGGYLDDSLVDCTVVPSDKGSAFYNCKSSFLNNSYLENMGVVVNKSVRAGE